MVWRWSKTAATNATADSTINWAEGMAPSAVNDSARAEMARVAQYRDDIAGAIVTTGTSTAYAVSSNQVFDTLANLDKAMIAFTPHATNTGTSTLNVDSLGAKPLRGYPGVELPSGSLILGTPYVAVYNNSDAVWYLHGGAANAYSIPLGSGIDYWGSTAPNSAFAFPIGQNISRTTYATLFSIIGTTYGVGDGSTTFTLPDKTGRVSAMKEASQNRLTSTYFNANSTALGAGGGSQNWIMSTTNLPPYTPSGSVPINDPGHTHPYNTYTNTTAGPGGAGVLLQGPTTANAGGSLTGITASFVGNAQGGNSTQISVIQPTIICNYIMRII